MNNHKTAIFPDFLSPEIKIGETLLSASANLENLGHRFFMAATTGQFQVKKAKPVIRC
jgi:hypothetical protein